MKKDFIKKKIILKFPLFQNHILEDNSLNKKFTKNRENEELLSRER